MPDTLNNFISHCLLYCSGGKFSPVGFSVPCRHWLRRVSSQRQACDDIHNGYGYSSGPSGCLARCLAVSGYLWNSLWQVVALFQSVLAGPFIKCQSISAIWVLDTAISKCQHLFLDRILSRRNSCPVAIEGCLRRENEKTMAFVRFMPLSKSVGLIRSIHSAARYSSLPVGW